MNPTVGGVADATIRERIDFGCRLTKAEREPKATSLEKGQARRWRLRNEVWDMQWENAVVITTENKGKGRSDSK